MTHSKHFGALFEEIHREVDPAIERLREARMLGVRQPERVKIYQEPQRPIVLPSLEKKFEAQVISCCGFKHRRQRKVGETVWPEPTFSHCRGCGRELEWSALPLNKQA